MKHRELRKAYLSAHDVLLGGSIAGVQKELARHIVDAHSQVCCSTHVNQLHLVVGLTDDDVLRLDIAVDNACGM